MREKENLGSCDAAHDPMEARSVLPRPGKRGRAMGYYWVYIPAVGNVVAWWNSGWKVDGLRGVLRDAEATVLSGRLRPPRKKMREAREARVALAALYTALQEEG